MLISETYPLASDLGFPSGVRAARKNWISVAKEKRANSRRGAIVATIGVTLLFSLLGLLPWMLQRATRPAQLQQRLDKPLPMGNAHLGAEYYNLGQAIVDGRGFSDPFIVRSGPSAWMPPLLVWIKAALIFVFGGDRYWVMVAVIAIKSSLIAALGAVVVRSSFRIRNGWTAFGVFATTIFIEYDACFAFTHDGWLILAGVTSTVFGLAWLDRKVKHSTLSIKRTVAWGSMGGLIALSSPIAGATWAIGTATCLLRRAPKRLCIAAIVSMAVVTPWAIRNRLVLGKFVPIKSNVFFEFDQSLAIDSDGLLDWQTMGKHPYHAGAEQDKYVAMGEMAYLETKKKRFLTQLNAQPGEFCRKVRNRLVATTLWPAGFSGFYGLRWLIYPLPAFALIAMLVFGRPLTSLQRYAIIVYVAYLVPYILCSYYPRYGFPLLIVKVMFCVWGIETMIKRNRGPEVPFCQTPSPTETNPTW